MAGSRGVFRTYIESRNAEDGFQLDNEQKEFVEFIFDDVWNFCTATWPLRGTKTRPAAPICWTQDKMRNEPRPFPHYEYLRDCILRPIFMAPRLGEDGRPLKLRFVVPKPRQFFVTNGILAGCLWHVLRTEAVEWLIAKNKAPEAEKFIKDRVRYMYRRLPSFLSGVAGPRSRSGYRTVNDKPAGRFTVEETLSHITAVSRTFGESGEAIGETANGLLDECIRIKNLPAVWAALDAQAPIIVAVSAPPEKGQPIDPRSLAFFRELCEGLEPGALVKTIVGRSDLERANEDDDFDEPDLDSVSALEMVN